jgi:multidrug efflux pump subunit AcrB
MWIVRFALKRPYTFVIVAVLIAIFGFAAIATTPTDILPEIDIPIVSVIWIYSGMDSDDMSKRIVGVCERALPTSVNNIQYTESQSYNGVGVIKIHFQAGVQVDLAIAQVTALAQQILRLMPPGILPPYVLKYDASSVPIVQVSLGGKGLSQTELYDLGQNFIRGQLATIKGAAVPLPYGGEQRSIMVDVDPIQLVANHLTASDLSLALNNQNLVTPSGTEKMGDREYLVGTNSSPTTIAALNALPIRASNGAILQMKDVAWIHNGYQPQTSYVSENGQASALLTVIKNGASSTLTIVDQVRAAIPKIKAGLPSALTLTPLFDQSVMVRASIQDVVQEAITAAFLTAMMVLVFLGSWRSTLIVSASIPLAVLFAIAVSSALGETINIMSLGGLALAVGMLVDDATVEIENTHRNLGVGEKKPLATAILDSAEQVAMPALISTLSICIVFVPVTLLSGSAKFIFTPLALSVVLALVASYGLSRTLVPTMMHFLLPREVPLYQGQENESPVSRSFIWRFHQKFERGFDKFAENYKTTLEWTLEHRVITLVLFAVISLGSLALIPSLGRDFFPYVDSGQMEFHVRPPVGTRIETAIEVFKQVNEEIRRVIPADQLQMVVNNIGLPPGGVNLAYSAADTTSNGDGDVLVLLSTKHRPTQEWMQILRQDFAKKFPQETVFFEPADITNQTLNFGLPAPIDVQVRGKNAGATAEIAERLQEQIKNVPGAVDVFMQQDVHAPKLNINVDRLKAQELALTAKDVSDNVLLSLSGSGQVAPNFWLDPTTGVEYPVIVQVPQSRLRNLDTLERTAVTSPIAGASDQLLSNVSETERQVSPQTVSHYNALPEMDVFANVEQRDLGGVASDVQKIIKQNSQHLPPGVEIVLSGQVLTMNTSFANLEIGIAAAVVFVYLLMAMNFQSWTIPFVILMALPGAFAGILWMLYLTQTTLNVPSLMGALMTIGVATANSILVVSFANESREDNIATRNSTDAALIAGTTRLRPVCMTALAMIIGMLPMALALGEGGEQNAPIGRAVIGGLLFATVGTLLIVPVIYSLMSKKPLVNWEKRLDDETQGAFQ